MIVTFIDSGVLVAASRGVEDLSVDILSGS